MSLALLLGSAWAAPVFPPLAGESLADVAYTLPGGLEGEQNLILFALAREHQSQVDSWIPFATQLEADVPGLRWYEVPLVDDVNFALEALIFNGMQSGIEDPLVRARTIPLFVPRAPVLASLEISDESQIRALLVDRSGVVRWQAVGPYSAESAAGLQALLQGP